MYHGIYHKSQLIITEDDRPLLFIDEETAIRAAASIQRERNIKVSVGLARVINA